MGAFFIQFKLCTEMVLPSFRLLSSDLEKLRIFFNTCSRGLRGLEQDVVVATPALSVVVLCIGASKNLVSLSL